MSNEDRIRKWQQKKPEATSGKEAFEESHPGEFDELFSELAPSEKEAPGKGEPAAAPGAPAAPVMQSPAARLREEIENHRTMRREGILRRLAVFVGIPLALIFAYGALVATPLYEGQAAFTVQTSGGDGGSPGSAGLIAFPGSSETISDAFKARAFILSRPMMEHMEREYGYISHFDAMDPLTRPGGLFGSEEDPLEFYRKRVKVSIDIQEGIVKLDVQALSQEDAVRFGNGILAAAEAHVNEVAKRIEQDQITELSANVTDAESQLTDARARVSDVRARQRDISPEQSAAVIYQLISSLELQLAEAQRQRQSLLDDGLVDSPLLPPLTARVAELRAQIQDNRDRLSGQEGGSLAQTASAFENANTSQEVALTRWQAAIDTLQQATLQILRERRYFVLIVGMSSGTSASVHDWWSIVLPMLILCLAGYLVWRVLAARGIVPAHALRDRAQAWRSKRA